MAIDYRKALALVGFALTTGCSLLLPANEPQCKEDADCEARGFSGTVCADELCIPADGGGGSGGSTGSGGNAGGSGPWDCVGNVVWEDITAEPMNVNVKLAHLLNEDPIPDAPAKTCGPLDTECISPLDEGISDASGTLALEAHFGFRGYTLVQPPPSFPEMAPAIMWSNPPLFVENPDPQTAHLTSEGDMSGVALLVGATIDPNLGHLFGLTLDCHGNLAADVALSADTVAPGTVAYYINGSLPSATAGATDHNGQAGFVNLPPGFITINATSLDTGKFGTVTVLVKAGHVTYVALAPSP